MLFFFVFQEKIKFPIFLPQWPFSLFVGKACLSDRIFSEFFFACGLINLRGTFGNSFFTQKAAVWKTLPISVFHTAFWVKKEFLNVTRKLISAQAKKNSEKIRSLRQVFPTKRENGRSLSQKKWIFIYKIKGKIIVSVTVDPVAPLQNNTSQGQTFGKMKLKIKKRSKKKKTIVSL